MQTSDCELSVRYWKSPSWPPFGRTRKSQEPTTRKFSVSPINMLTNVRTLTMMVARFVIAVNCKELRAVLFDRARVKEECIAWSNSFECCARLNCYLESGKVLLVGMTVHDDHSRSKYYTSILRSIYS